MNSNWFGNLDEFTRGYFECALWSSQDENGDDLDDCTVFNIDETTRLEMMKDCENFQEHNAELLEKWYYAGESPDRAGHDFWLTRNGHGAGFWDRFSPNPGNMEPYNIGKKLTANAKVYREYDLMLNDNGKIYVV